MTKKLEDLKPFFEYVKNKKVVSENTATSWVAAVSALSEQLEPEERTVEFVLDNSDLIKNRLQNSNHNLKGETIDVYIKRSSIALRHYLAWQKDRSAWEREMASRGISRSATIKTAKTAKSAERPANDGTRTQDEQTHNPSARRFPIPINDSDAFTVELPTSYAMDDLVRVVWALAVYAKDFNPAAVLARYGAPAPAGSTFTGNGTNKTTDLAN